MDPSSFKCPICHYGFETDFLDSMRIHCSKKHKLSSKDLYVKLFLNGVEPKCKCGCGETPKFWTLQRGFAEYIRGHHSRVKNNWGHNTEAQKKSQDVRREMHKRGEISIWNKGETKETDERIAALGRTGSHTLKTDPECQRQRAEHMSEQWKTGSIVPLTGPNHSQWKGGTSSLQQLTRSALFRAWSRPIMERDKFTCQHCGKQGDLCVHHDKERFAEVLHKAMQHFQVEDATQLTFEQKYELSTWVIDYHLDNKVSGVTLCTDCHAIVHLGVGSIPQVPDDIDI